MDLYRNVVKQLENWYTSKYGLIVYGARQVGKTYILKKFLNEKFSNVVYLNLYENINAIPVLLNLWKENKMLK